MTDTPDLFAGKPNIWDWADKVAQANNTRANRLLTLEGKTLTAAQWARKTGIASSILLKRLDRGWSIEKAFTATVREANESVYLTWQGRTQIIADWAREVGLSRGVLGFRIRSGWDIERALTTPTRKQKKAK